MQGSRRLGALQLRQQQAEGVAREGLHVGGTVRGGGFQCPHRGRRSGDGQAAVPRRIPVPVTRGPGSARLGQAPVGPQGLADALCQEARIGLRRGPHALQVAALHPQQTLQRPARIDDAAAEIIGRGTGHRQQGGGDQAPCGGFGHGHGLPSGDQVPGHGVGQLGEVFGHGGNSRLCSECDIHRPAGRRGVAPFAGERGNRYVPPSGLASIPDASIFQ